MAMVPPPPQPQPLRRLSSFPSAPTAAFGSLLGFVSDTLLKSQQSTEPDTIALPEREMTGYRSPGEPSAREREASGTQMHLSTDCQACGERVAVAVPAWMLNAMEASRNMAHAHGAIGTGGPDDRRDYRVGSGRRGVDQSPWRDSVVTGAVRAAQLIRDSPLPAFLYQIFATFLAFAIYMDKRFSLHQKLLIMLAALLEGLIEIEKEVGIFRNAGEWLSVLWEASIKGTIALARSSQPTPSHTPTHTPSHLHHQYGSASYPSSPPMRATTSQSSYLTPSYAPFAGVPEYELDQLTAPGTNNTAYTSALQVHGSGCAPPPVLVAPKTLRRTSYSSPSLPLLLSSSSSSHLLPTTGNATASSSSSSSTIPILTREHSQRPASGNPPDYASATHGGASHQSGSMNRQRSRSEERCSRDRDGKGGELEIESSEVVQRGWAGRVVGVVGRMARGD